MPTPDFIFMLTRADRTIANAAEVVQIALKTGIKHIGFKDVGLPFDALFALAEAIRDGGATVYLEVVSLDEASERASAEMALRLGVDVLMGGTRPDVVVPILSDSGMRYLPFAGKVTGHPSTLNGTIAEIVADAVALAERPEVDGVDLLAYRFSGDVPALIRAVGEAIAPKRLVVAGSIDRMERIEILSAAGAAGFTIGTAALDGALPAPPGIDAQLAWVMGAISHATDARAVAKVNLAERFASFDEKWQPKIVGDLNGFQVKLAKFAGPFHWHHHELEDELFLVFSGRLRMGFRDHHIDLDPGEFIIVPRGVEHRPEALDGECAIILLEPSTTINTGNVVNERTISHPDQIA